MKFCKDQFIFPTNDFAAAYAMSWVAPVTREDLSEIMLSLKSAGVRKLYILPQPKEFRPVINQSTMSPDYMSDEFLDLMEFFCEKAEELGFSLWLYDEGGWPSGSACTQITKLRPDLKRKWITAIPIELTKGMEYRIPISHENLLAVYLKDKNGKHTRICEDFVYDGEGEVFEYRYLDNFNTYMYNDEYNTDILNPETADLFLKLTHEKYKAKLGKYFGGLLPYIFNDEPAVESFAWTKDLEKRFYKDFGYDILDFLPFIIGNEKTETESQKQALCDFKKILCRLMIENFFLPIKAWCKENNIKFIGHLDGDHNAERFINSLCYAYPLEVLRCYDIPGVDAIWRHIYPEGYGAPSFQEAVQFFPLFATSAASQIGSRFALTESLAVYGMATSPSIMRYVFGAQAVRGINLFNVMSLDATNSIVRPIFRPERPNFEHLSEINRYLERLSYLASLGVRQCENAVYMPCEDIMKYKNADNFHKLGRKLEKEHVTFEIIDDCFIEKAEIKDGKLCMGLAAYKNVFIPQGANLPEKIKAKLEGFIKTEAKPICYCNNQNIITEKRKLDDGSVLYFAFNEHKDTQDATFKFDESIPCYRIYIEEGRIEKAEEFSVSLQMGETAVYIFTIDDIITDKPFKTAESFTLEAPFNLKKEKEFIINEAGTALTDCESEEIASDDGRFSAHFGKDFSGLVTYTKRFKLDKDFLNADAFMLDLGEIEYTAEVKINGKSAGIISLMPYRKIIDKGILTEDNLIEISVANTAANAIQSADVYSWHSMGKIGPYHTRVGVYEREFLGGGLIGPVTLTKLL